jgi:hypothetical protein
LGTCARSLVSAESTKRSRAAQPPANRRGPRESRAKRPSSPSFRGASSERRLTTTLTARPERQQATAASAADDESRPDLGRSRTRRPEVRRRARRSDRQEAARRTRDALPHDLKTGPGPIHLHLAGSSRSGGDPLADHAALQGDESVVDAGPVGVDPMA